ncbi:MAG: lipocalin family protein [Gemmatimonadetes bacterium]|nr:lipocalin family protein [Gemmatimonadota bacterium]NNM05690.1 lipocalin family protein [Gemmatimonadota bacterium]
MEIPRRARFGMVLLAAIVAVPTIPAGAQENSPPKMVDFVDLERYAGLWYEIARVPNGFQDQCVRNVTAEYVLRDDGRIDVINRCMKEDGSEDKTKGLARIEDKESNAFLKVSFFSILGWRPVWGDYRVIGLGDDYEYALVGTADRKFGWILAREPELSESVLEGLYQQLQDQGYPDGSFAPTLQSWDGSR